MASKKKSKKSGPSPAKAKKMLEDGMANGHPMTPKQKRYMGWVAGGSKPRKRTRGK